MTPLSFSLLLLLTISVNTIDSFTIGRVLLPRKPALTRRCAAHQLSECFAANEFSRLLDPQRVLKIGTASSSHRSRREYHMAIKATVEECQALAKRFDLPTLGPLQADAVLRPAAVTSAVEVEGSIRATLTQRCVRTNEDFSIDVEFPLYAIVRPVVPLNVGLVPNVGDHDAASSDEDVYASSFDDTPRSNHKKPPPNLDSLDVFQLQQLLQDDDNDDELADALMEDQAIHPVGGPMDVGELVAQLFWLQLDPYPKKPGSEPMQRSISG